MLLQPRPFIPGLLRRRLVASGDLDLPMTGLLADWYAGDGSDFPSWMTIDTLNDDRVQVWGGTDGTGINLGTESFGGQPFFEQNVAAFNNRAGVRFDGGQFVYLARASIIANLTEYASFMIYRSAESSSGSTRVIYNEGNTGSITPILVQRINDVTDGNVSQYHRSGSGTTNNMSGGTNSNDGNAHLITVLRLASNDYRLRMDGVEVDAEVVAPGSTSINIIALGCMWRTSRSNYLNGHIGRVRHYNTTSHYADVEAALAEHYGLTLG